MCDSMAVVEPGRVLFAKNSDRDANEGQNLEWHPRRKNNKNATLKCTWIEIPDVEETYATLLSRPFWIWGAEIGSNEHGVTIGNESVFTKEPYESEPGLIGMDLLRLALERAATAEDACAVIANLLETYGQGGGCGHENKKFVYHNSFIIADPTAAYVLETAGRTWTTEAISGGRSISNALTIPDFRDTYSDYLYTKMARAHERQGRTQELCQRVTSPADLMKILRDHGDKNDAPKYDFTTGGLSAPCVHGGGTVASSQTTASWVAELSPEGCRHWVTGTSAPCTAIFKPVTVDQPIDLGPRAEDRVNDSLWWRHEKLHRNVMRNPQTLGALFSAERDQKEAEWLENPPDSETAFNEGNQLLKKWTAAVADAPPQDVRPVWTRRYWTKRNKIANLSL